MQGRSPLALDGAVVRFTFGEVVFDYVAEIFFLFVFFAKFV